MHRLLSLSPLVACSLLLVPLMGCPSPTTTPTPGAGSGTTVGRTIQKDPGRHPSGVVLKKTPESLVNRQEKVPAEITYDGGFVNLTYSQAVLLSEQKQLPIMFYVYTQWCGPCKQLAEKVFPDPLFIQFMQKNMVALKVDAAEEPWREIAEAMGVHSYPTMIVCEPGGKPIEKFFAFHPTAEFLQTVQDYVNHVNTATWHKEQALANPDDLGLMMKAGKELAIRERGEEAIPFLEAILEEDSDPASVRVPEALFLLGRSIYLDQMKQPEKAIPLLDDLAKRFPTTYYGTEALYTMARIYLDQKQQDKAIAILLDRVKTPDYDAVSFFRFASFCQQYNILLDEATSRLEKAIAAHPEARYLVKVLADLHFRAQRYGKAVELMEQLLAEEPKNDIYIKTLNNYKTVRDKVEKKQ